MIKIIDSRKVGESSLEVDQYVPFSFRCYEVHDTPSLWWRTGNLKTSFIEIGMTKETGAIYDVTIVSLPHVSISNLPNDNILSQVSVIDGLPICEIEKKYKENENIEYIDEEKELISYLNESSIYIWFGSICEILRFYKTDRICFGVNNNMEICLLKFDSLSLFEIEKVLRN
jgi:hypothetical protein